MRTHGHREGSTKHGGLLGKNVEGQWDGDMGRDSLGLKCQMWVKGRKEANTLFCVYLRNCLACSAHVPQNLKCNKKFKKKKRKRRNVL